MTRTTTPTLPKDRRGRGIPILGAVVLAGGLAVAAAPPRPAPSASAARAAAIMAEVERLVAAEADAHSAEPVDVERRIHGLGREFDRMDAGAVEPLARYLADKNRPNKARMYAAAFLGLDGDPGALRPLYDRLTDWTDDPALRSTCLNSIASLRLRPETTRKVAESVLKAGFGAAGGKLFPPTIAREAAMLLAQLGAWDVGLAASAAERDGPDPQDAAAAEAEYLVRALAVSKNPKAPGALFDLLAFYRHGSRLESEVLGALESRRSELVGLDESRLRLLTDVLLRERGPNALRAAKLLGELRHPLAVQPLLSALESPDPALVAEAAEALAQIGDPAAAAPLGRLSNGLLSDRRFAPSPGGPDVAALAERVQRAAQAFPSNK